MSAGVRGLAVSLWLVALAGPAPSWAQQETAEALAARILGASAIQRREMLAREDLASVEVARALLDAGDKALGAADFPPALVAFRAAETAASRAGAQPEAARALIGAANVLGGQGEFRLALEAAQGSLRAYERLGDAKGQANAWKAIGNNHFATGDNAEALAAYRKASDLFASVPDRAGVARALNNIANVLIELTDFDEALRRLEEALRVFEEVDDRRAAAVVTNNISRVHMFRGEYPQALKFALASLAMKEALGNRVDIATSLDLLGNIHRSQGAYARALDFFERALKVRQEIGDKNGTLQTWHNIGLLRFSQGEYRLAIDAYKRALRMNTEIGGTLLASALYNIGAAARQLGERRRAEANYRESLRVCESKGYKDIGAENLNDLGRMALEEGRWREAEVLLNRALAVREVLKDKAGQAEALNGLAAVSLAAHRPAEALERSRRAAEMARAYEQRENQWEADTLSGMAYRRLGQPAAARRSLEDAVAVIEGLRLEVAGGAAGAERFFEGKLSPYHELMALALERGAAADALELAERSKARVLSDLLERGRADVRRAMTDADRGEDVRLRGAVVSVNQKILAERQKETPDAARLSALDADRQSARFAYEAFQAAVEAKHPELALQRGHAAPFAFAEAAPLLADDSVAVIEYAVTEENAYLFLVSRTAGVATVESHALGAGRASLATRAARLRGRLAARDLAFTEDARALFDLLLGPALPRLKGKAHLVVVPDGALWDVPFQALQDHDGHYLIESAAVSYAPSLTILRETLRRPRSDRPRTVLAMGKSDFGAKGAPPAIALMSDLGPLPDAERQVREIAALYGPDRSTTYVGPEAREDRFKTEAPRYSILHLATHGVLDESSPLYSNVVLSPGSSGSSEDGLLEAWELMDLKLNADLVILSACETGRGRIAPGEGIVGTMWAAFVAGSRALLVSQWKVESGSTTDLMTAFHRGLARGEAGKAEQLRRASLALLRSPRYAHPFYWAGFVLVGNPY